MPHARKKKEELREWPPLGPSRWGNRRTKQGERLLFVDSLQHIGAALRVGSAAAAETAARITDPTAAESSDQFPLFAKPAAAICR